MGKRSERETEAVTPRIVHDHGDCKDCGKPVDVVVDIHQSAGGNRFICVDCRCARIKEKAAKDIGMIQENTKEARAEVSGAPALQFPNGDQASA